MAISAKVTDQLVTESGTTVTVMELSPFTHLNNTEATIEAGVACQPYGVVMAPADAPGDTEIKFTQHANEDLNISLSDIKSYNKGDVIEPKEDIVIDPKTATFWDSANIQPGNYDNAKRIFFDRTGFINLSEDYNMNQILLLYNGDVNNITSASLGEFVFKTIFPGKISPSNAAAATSKGAKFYVNRVDATVNAIYAYDPVNYESFVAINRNDLQYVVIEPTQQD